MSDEGTPLTQWATAINEMFTALMGAGFTEQQALQLLALWMRAAPSEGESS